MVASKHLAPTQCQALEAKAEELPPPSLSEDRVGEGRAKASCLPSGLPGLFFQPIPVGVLGTQRCPPLLPGSSSLGAGVM